MSKPKVVVISPKGTPNRRNKRNGAKTTTNSNRISKAEKGIYELSIFCAAIVTGTACSISSKVMYDLQGIGSDGTLQYFDKPLIQTLGMFLAMILGLPLHWIIIHCNISFPGYSQFKNRCTSTTNEATSSEEELTLLMARHHDDSTHSDDSEVQSLSTVTIPPKTYLILAIPAIFDLTTTLLCLIGLVYLDVSIYQLLRGSGIIFTALIRQSALHQPLFHFQWMGVILNVLSVVLVGITALLDSTRINESHTTQQVFMAIVVMLLGTLVQSMQFVFEEKVMVQDEIKVPPLLLFGMEGIWGTVLCLAIMYPIGCVIPGCDNGMFEDPYNTWVMLKNTRSIQYTMAIYLLAIFGYNLFAVLVTFSLSSIWHSILDNFRPMTVWMTDLFIYYYVWTSGDFGEAWTRYSPIQLVGMVVLITGTMIYNAPDSGSILVKGQWYFWGLNFESEYNEIRAQRLFSMGSYPSLQRFACSARHVKTDRGAVSIVHSPKSGRYVPETQYGSVFQTQQSI